MDRVGPSRYYRYHYCITPTWFALSRLMPRQLHETSCLSGFLLSGGIQIKYAWSTPHRGRFSTGVLVLPRTDVLDTTLMMSWPPSLDQITSDFLRTNQRRAFPRKQAGRDPGAECINQTELSRPHPGTTAETKQVT